MARQTEYAFYGRLAERSIAAVLKTVEVMSLRGFKSLTFRQSP